MGAKSILWGFGSPSEFLEGKGQDGDSHQIWPCSSESVSLLSAGSSSRRLGSFPDLWARGGGGLAPLELPS